MKRWFRKVWTYIRFGTITHEVIATVGYRTPAEIIYKNRHGKVIGFWAYGYFHPDYPYRGN